MSRRKKVSAIALATELASTVGGNSPTEIAGGYRWSDRNEAARFTTYSPEHNQKVVVVVSVFEDGSAALGFFSDEGLSGTSTYENITHFNYNRPNAREMTKDIKWVWETVDGYAASHQPEVDEAKPSGGDTELRSALTNLLEFVTSGRRYKTQNPYTIPEVQAAFKALGRDWRKE